MPCDKVPPTAFTDEILAEFSSERPKAVLYHYTTQKGLLGILKSREIWATHHQCLNDYKEFVHAKELLRQELATNPQADALLSTMRLEMDGEGFESVNLYVASFSEDPDSLAQWRAYGGATSGFSLGFDFGDMAFPRNFTVKRCIYDQNTQREITRNVVAKIVTRLRDLPREILETPHFVNPYARVFPPSRFTLLL